MKNPYKNRRRLVWIFGAALLGFLPLTQQNAVAQGTASSGGAEMDEEIIELSPFTISADDQTGYQATSTLAGTRIKTDLKDLGSAISVVTKDFMEDTGTTNVADLLVYTTGTEVGGAFGNFGGAGTSTGDVNQNNNNRANPTGNTRIRGLSAASVTRDFYLTDMGFDGYNTEMVTISRGPNSILFGIGEPAGIIDNSLKKAMIGRDITQISARIGSNGTYRGTLDVNRDLVEDRVAVRLNAMHENIQYRQDPTYEEDTRFYLAAKAVLLENKNVDWLDKTILRANWETAEIRGTPPDMIPPKDHFSWWWGPPGSAAADAITGLKPDNSWPDDYREQYAAPHWVINQITPDLTTPGLTRSAQPELWNSYAVIFAEPNGGPTVGIPSGEDYRGIDWGGTQVIHGTSGRFDFTYPNGDTTRTPGWFPNYSTMSNGGFSSYGFGFQDHVIMNRDVLDYEKLLLQGEMQYSNHDFDAYNVALEQTFLGGSAGIELALDHQEYSNERWFPFGRHVYKSIKIDTGVYLPNGSLNPNLGRPMMTGQIDPVNYSTNELDTKRLTAFYELDFRENDNWSKWLGTHMVTGLASAWERDNRNHGVAPGWDTTHDKDQTANNTVGPAGSWGGRMFGWAYVGDGQWNANSPDEVRLYTSPLNLEFPKAGDFLNNYWVDGVTQRNDDPDLDTVVPTAGTVRVRNINLFPGRRRQEVDSLGFTWQGRFLQDNLVLTYGRREDDAKTWEIQSIQNPDRSNQLEESWVNWKNNGDPVLDESGTTTTVQAVLHVPTEWTSDWPGNPTFSAHYSESENFNPASVRRDLLNNLIDSPNGETTEYGFTVGLLRNRASLRFNWFETTSKNVTNTNITGSLWQFTWPDGFASRWVNAKNGWVNGTGPSFEEIVLGNPNDVGYPDNPPDPTLIGNFTSYDQVINTLLFDVLPQETIEGMNLRLEGEPGNQEVRKDGIAGLSSAADVVSQGFELEGVFNVTDSWRISMNVAQVESIFSNGLKVETPFEEEVTARIKALGLWDISRGGWTETTRVSQTWGDTIAALANAAAKEGTPNPELRKWRANFVTNYSFREGRLKGFGVGGAIRWQDKISTGFPLERNADGVLAPVVSQPFYGSSDTAGDLWFSYGTRWWDNVGVKFQLNLVNALGSSDPTVIATNPDGEVAIIRASPEKRWFFTTTFDF